MSETQFLILVVLITAGLFLFVAAVPWSVERAINIRWKEILTMFDRALMHGGSLDTLADAIRKSAEESQHLASEAKAKADVAIEAVSLLHGRVRALEDHPFLRPVGGNHHGEPHEP